MYVLLSGYCAFKQATRCICCASHKYRIDCPWLSSGRPDICFTQLYASVNTLHTWADHCMADSIHILDALWSPHEQIDMHTHACMPNNHTISTTAVYLFHVSLICKWCSITHIAKWRSYWLLHVIVMWNVDRYCWYHLWICAGGDWVPCCWSKPWSGWHSWFLVRLLKHVCHCPPVMKQSAYLL